jgi:predicted nucleotidyltransferase
MLSLRSELRRKVLTFFYVNRAARVYVRKLAADLGVDPTNLSRELSRLAHDGFLRAETEGRQLYYSVNRDYPFLKPLFDLLKGSVGIRPTLTEAIAGIAGIKSAYLYGSFAKNEADAASDIDLLIVGQPDQGGLAAEIRKAEQVLRREINYTVVSPRELERRLAADDAFLADIWNGKRIELIDNELEKAEQDQAASSQSKTGKAVRKRRMAKGRLGSKDSAH